MQALLDLQEWGRSADAGQLEALTEAFLRLVDKASTKHHRGSQSFTYVSLLRGMLKEGTTCMNLLESLRLPAHSLLPL